MLEPCEGKLSCTVLRGEAVVIPLAYPTITAVLDGFHLEKQLLKLLPCPKKKERAPVLEEFRKTI